MYLKRFDDNKQKSIYLCQKNTNIQGSIEVYLLQEDKSYLLQISDETDSVKRWSTIIDVTVEEYLKQFVSAITDSNESPGDHKDVFHIDKKTLVWEQSSSKNGEHIQGKIGKFKLEEIDNTKGIQQLLDTILLNRDTVFSENAKFKTESEKYKAEKEEALKLAEESVVMKENLENEILSKFVQILNSKTERIIELESQLSAYNGTATSSITQATSSATSIPSTSKAPASNTSVEQEDEFDRDTDIDEVIDTDDEEPKPSDGTKRKFISKSSDVSPSKIHCSGSPDLFNMSIEADLHDALTKPVASSASRRRNKNNGNQGSINIGTRNSNVESNGSYLNNSIDSSTLTSNNSTSDNSILKQFFNC